MAGYSLLFLSWIGLCLVAGTVAVLAWRIHDEEILMREQFGAEWEAYAKRSRRLVPFLY